LIVDSKSGEKDLAGSLAQTVKETEWNNKNERVEIKMQSWTREPSLFIRPSSSNVNPDPGSQDRD
jgi:hypothetical protein